VDLVELLGHLEKRTGQVVEERHLGLYVRLRGWGDALGKREHGCLLSDECSVFKDRRVIGGGIGLVMEETALVRIDATGSGANDKATCASAARHDLDQMCSPRRRHRPLSCADPRRTPLCSAAVRPMPARRTWYAGNHHIEP
jgi:hypothetical protein